METVSYYTNLMPPLDLFNVELFRLWCIYHNVNIKNYQTCDCIALANVIPCNMICQTHP